MPFGNTETHDFQTANWNSVPAVYGIMNEKQQMIYVGETEDLKRRMAEHHTDKTHCMHRYGPRLVRAEVLNEGQLARRRREQALIAEFSPPCNG